MRSRASARMHNESSPLPRRDGHMVTSRKKKNKKGKKSLLEMEKPVDTNGSHGENKDSLRKRGSWPSDD